MNIKNLTQTVKNFLFELFGKEADVISVTPVDKGWQVNVEILMDEEYTMKRGRCDLLSVFEVLVDPNLNILSYTRIRIRERGKIDE
jgi:hypothetical protein